MVKFIVILCSFSAVYYFGTTEGLHMLLVSIQLLLWELVDAKK